jgi:hypothetical protein
VSGDDDGSFGNRRFQFSAFRQMTSPYAASRNGTIGIYWRAAQPSARFALDLLGRMTGRGVFFGCGSSALVQPFTVDRNGYRRESCEPQG